MAGKQQIDARKLAGEVVSEFVVLAQAQAREHGGEGKGNWVRLEQKFGDVGTCIAALVATIGKANIPLTDDGIVDWPAMGLVVKPFKWGQLHVRLDDRKGNGVHGLRLI